MQKTNCLKVLSFLVMTLIIVDMIPVVSVKANSTQKINETVFDGGNGTKEEPYLISNKHQLNNIRNELSAHYKLINDIVFEKSDFLEGGSFYNDGYGWEPIGLYWDNPFDGVLNGNGFSVHGLCSKFNNSTVGFIGNNTGTILNLNLLDGNISSQYLFSNSFIGAFVGQNYGSIINCHSKNTTITALGLTGGITGENIGRVSNCSSEGKIFGDGIIGGIVGCNQGDQYSIEYCYSNSNIIIDTTKSSEVGGIAGCNYGIIHNCFNKGEINVTSTYNNCESMFERVAVGGIAGQNSDFSSIKQCCNHGNLVLNSSDTNGYCGGIVGFNWYAPVTDCYNIGKIFGESKSTLGGIIGIATNGGVFTNCYNVGDIISAENSHIGGFCGYYDNINEVDYSTTGCYYLNTCINSSVNDLGIKLTHDEMIVPTSYSKFDFDSIWVINDTDNYRYPSLRQMGCKNISSIYIETMPNKIKYTINENLSSIGGKLRLVYDDTSTEVVDVCYANITGFNNTKLGRQTLTVTYCGKITSYNIEVCEKKVTSIKITKTPDKLVYIEGNENLDVTGGEITVIYNQHIVEVVDITLDMVSGFDNNKLGKQTLTVTYGDYVANYEIEVVEKSISFIFVSETPEKIVYIKKDGYLDIKGGKLCIVYNNGSTVLIDITSTMLEDYDISVEENQTITIKHNNFSTTFKGKITVIYELLGDVDNDGNITIMDATTIQMHIANLSIITKEKQVLADTDKDGDITIKDVTTIQMLIAHLIPSL